MGWMCVQAPYPPQERPEVADTEKKATGGAVSVPPVAEKENGTEEQTDE